MRRSALLACTDAVQGWALAQKNCMISYNIERSKLALAERITPGHESPTITPLEDAAWVAVNALIPTNRVSDIMDQLIDIGARSILIFSLINCRF